MKAQPVARPLRDCILTYQEEKVTGKVFEQEKGECLVRWLR